MNPPSTPPPNLENFLDLPVNLTAELGSCCKPARDMLQLGIGSVVKLDDRTGGQLHLYVGPRLVARGEIVLEANALAIKVTSLVGENGARIESLTCSDQ